MDFRKCHNVDPSYYEFIGEHPPPIQCHVWVKAEVDSHEVRPTVSTKRSLPSDPKYQEIVMDCRELSIQRASKNNFRRSSAQHAMSRHDDPHGVESAGGEVEDVMWKGTACDRAAMAEIEMSKSSGSLGSMQVHMRDQAREGRGGGGTDFELPDVLDARPY